MAIGNGTGNSWNDAGDSSLAGGINVNSGFLDSNGELNFVSGDKEVKKFFNTSNADIYYKHIFTLSPQPPTGSPGDNWFTGTTGIDDQWNTGTITYFDYDKYFYATNKDTDDLYKTGDGTSWSLVDTTFTGNHKLHAFGDYIFRSNFSTTVERSQDGTNWSSVGTVAHTVSYLMSANNVLFAFYSTTPSNVRMSYSTNNGDTWTEVSSMPLIQYPKSIAYDGSRMVMVGTYNENTTNGSVYSDDNGVNWIAGAPQSQAKYDKVTYFNGKFVALFKGIATSSDGTNFTEVVSETDFYSSYNRMNSIVNTGTKLFVSMGGNDSGESADIISSTDGTNWSIETATVPTDVELAFGNGRIIGVPVQGYVSTSSDFYLRSPIS